MLGALALIAAFVWGGSAVIVFGWLTAATILGPEPTLEERDRLAWELSMHREMARTRAWEELSR